MFNKASVVVILFLTMILDAHIDTDTSEHLYPILSAQALVVTQEGPLAVQ